MRVDKRLLPKALGQDEVAAELELATISKAMSCLHSAGAK
jgi:hypothetical protein